MSTRDWAQYLAPIGRAAFVLPFLWFSPLRVLEGSIAYAGGQGVPLPQVLVPLAGVISPAGGLSVLLGYRARLGAWLLVLFLVPAMLFMHRFWTIRDPAIAEMQLGFFMGNLSRVGAALFIVCVGAGPLSLDARGAASMTAR